MLCNASCKWMRPFGVTTHQHAFPGLQCILAAYQFLKRLRLLQVNRHCLAHFVSPIPFLFSICKERFVDICSIVKLLKDRKERMRKIFPSRSSISWSAIAGAHASSGRRLSTVWANHLRRWPNLYWCDLESITGLKQLFKMVLSGLLFLYVSSCPSLTLLLFLLSLHEFIWWIFESLLFLLLRSRSHGRQRQQCHCPLPFLFSLNQKLPRLHSPSQSVQICWQVPRQWSAGSAETPALSLAELSCWASHSLDSSDLDSNLAILYLV